VSATRDPAFLVSLVHELRRLPTELEWVEFKRNRCEPEEIGQYLSALSNGAALAGKAFAFVLWGIDDTTHEVVGTTFDPASAKVGNENLENWLLRLLTPKIAFQFYRVQVDQRSVVVLEIGQAFRHPVQFQGIEYIRVGSYVKKLRDFAEKERTLWRIFDTTPFERLVAADELGVDEVLRLVDYPAYFDLLHRPLPEGRDGILEALAADELVSRTEAGRWNVTNLGAVLFAKRLADFRELKRRAVRVIQYRGNSRLETVKEIVGTRGYASGFDGLIGYVNGLLPSNEVIRQAMRVTVPIYPELAIRELVANALIHQDLFVTGAGPMVEIFDDRMEITNPGAPLVDVERFLDTPPRSRNEALASLMRRIGVCEERGSGIDKVVSQTELYQLPAPAFEVIGDSTRAVLFAHRKLNRMDRADRVRACYLHACLKYVNRDYLTNGSLRERFGIEPRNAATASRLIREAVEDGAIVPYDATAAPKLMRYLPWWAGVQNSGGTVG
jgi:predicted HTH transcriptional regulator